MADTSFEVEQRVTPRKYIAERIDELTLDSVGTVVKTEPGNNKVVLYVNWDGLDEKNPLKHTPSHLLKWKEKAVKSAKAEDDNAPDDSIKDQDPNDKPSAEDIKKRAADLAAGETPEGSTRRKELIDLLSRPVEQTGLTKQWSDSTLKGCSLNTLEEWFKDAQPEVVQPELIENQDGTSEDATPGVEVASEDESDEDESDEGETEDDSTED